MENGRLSIRGFILYGELGNGPGFRLFLLIAAVNVALAMVSCALTFSSTMLLLTLAVLAFSMYGCLLIYGHDSENGQFATLRQVSPRVLIPAGILFFMMSLAIVGDGTPFLTVVPLIGLSWCLGIILAFRRVCDGE